MANLAPFGSRNLLDELFRDFTSGYYVKPLHGDPLPAQIKVDVGDSKEAYTIKAEVPGVKKDDIHVSIDGSVVTISAEVKQEDKQTKDEQVLRAERYYGSVSRSFQLPQEVDVGAAKAKYENGVLNLTLPKIAPVSTRRLAID